MISIFGQILRWYAYLKPTSFWGDEFYNIELVRHSLYEVFIGTLKDVHPPLFPVILKLVTLVFGFGELSLRLIPVLSGIWLLVGMHLLAKRLFNNRVAVITLAFTAISPYFLHLSEECRGYGLLACLVVWATLAFVERWKVAYVTLAVCAIYTEHYAWAWLIGMTLIAHRFNQHTMKKWHYIVITLSIPSLILIWSQAIHAEHMFDASRVGEYQNFIWMVKKISGVFWHIATGYRFSMLEAHNLPLDNPFFWLEGVAAGLFTFVIMRALVTSKYICLIFPIMFLAIFYPVRLDARYMSFLAPALVMSFCYEVWRLPKAVKIAVLGVVLLSNALGTVYALSLSTDPIHKEDYPKLFREVINERTELDAVIGLRPQVDYYGFSLFFNQEISDTTEKVYYMDLTNMQERVRVERFLKVADEMNKYGFNYGSFITPSVPGSLTVVYLFTRDMQNSHARYQNTPQNTSINP